MEEILVKYFNVANFCIVFLINHTRTCLSLILTLYVNNELQSTFKMFHFSLVLRKERILNKYSVFSVIKSLILFYTTYPYDIEFST